VTPDQSLEEPFSCCAITLALQVHIDHFAILIHCPPKVMLLAIDLDEDFIDVESVSIASVFSFQSQSEYGSEFYAPEADGLSGYSDAPFGE